MNTKTAEVMINYFTIIEEENFQLLALIDKQVIQNYIFLSLRSL